MFQPFAFAAGTAEAVIVGGVVSAVQSTEAVRSQWPPSSLSSDQNADLEPLTHSEIGCTVKPSLFRFCVAPVGREYTVWTWKVPWWASAFVSIWRIELRPWQPLSQVAQSASCDGSHSRSWIVWNPVLIVAIRVKVLSLLKT